MFQGRSFICSSLMLSAITESPWPSSNHLSFLSLIPPSFPHPQHILAIGANQFGNHIRKNIAKMITFICVILIFIDSVYLFLFIELLDS